MIETETTWEDSGYDCDHCGGVILKRIDRESGLPDRVRYQCRECSCQWELDGRLTRAGTGRFCKAVEQAGTGGFDAADVTQWVNLLSRNLWILLAIIAGVFFLRFSGGLVARYLLPALLVGVGVYALVRYGQRQQWW